MRKLIVFLFCLNIVSNIAAQGFSNKGTDFWITYPGHIDGNTSEMGIYITSNTSAIGTIYVGTGAGAQTIPFTVTANSVTKKFIGLLAGSDASNNGVYLNQSDGIVTGAAIHVVSNDNPVVVYAHIIKTARSGATLVLPSNVWGNSYVVPSYKSVLSSTASTGSGVAGGIGLITVVAAQANTTIQITPAATSLNGSHKAGQAYTKVLVNPGDVYQVQFQSLADISGTLVQSIANSSGACQKIAVFSSTSWSAFGCNSASSGDNLYQQLFPVSSWGKTFITAPAKTRTSDIIRVYVADAATVIQKTQNGVTAPLTGIVNTGVPNSYYYEYSTGIGNVNYPTYLQSNNPISVVQYFSTMACQNGATIGDPEMIVINPIEQTINNITVFSAHQKQVLGTTTQSNVTNCYLNIIIKSNATGSFQINGTSPAAYGNFTAIPGTAYSYMQADVSTISATNPIQTLTADSNFIAIAYGFGNVESYGYNAGTNVKDFTQLAAFRNPYAVIDSAISCVNTPFQFSIPLSFQPTSIQWDFSKAPNISPNAGIVSNTPSSNLDSTSILSGLYYYSTKNTYSFVAPNTSSLQRDTIKVYTTSATADGCGSTSQSYSIPVSSYPLPSASFTFTSSGCASDSIHFFDATNTHGTSTIITGLWNYGDGTKDSIYNPVKLYAAPGTDSVRYRPISTYGCSGDTTIILSISSQPIAKFGLSDTTCVNKSITFTDSSSIAVGTIAKWYWDYGNGKKDTLTTNVSRTQSYAAGTYTVSLIVQSSTGCMGTAFTKNITVHVLPAPNFSLPIVCMPIGAAQFYDSSTITDGTQNNLKYKWEFGDGGIDSVKNPLHYYASVSPVTVKLSVASQYGCVKDSSKTLSTLYLQPKANFTVSNEVCLRDTTVFSDGSDGKGSSVVKWRWNYGDGSTDTLQNTKHLYTSAKTDTVRLFVYTDKGCMSDTAIKTTIVDTLPVAKFNYAAAYYCETRPVTFTDQSIANNAGTITNWYWNMGNGNTYNLSNNAAFKEAYTLWGNYNVQLAIQSSKGCKSDTITKSITLNPLPHVGFILPEVCLSDALANFSDTSTIADGTASSFSYLWNFNAGSPAIVPGPAPINTTTKTTSTHYNIYGHYTVSLKVTSNNGCDSTLAQAFTVNGSTPVPKFVILDSAKLCSNLPVVFKDLSTVNFGNVTYEDIHWDMIHHPLLDSIDHTVDSTHQKTHSYSYQNFQNPSTQKYLVKLIAHSGLTNVCADSITQTITIHQSPKVQFNTLPGICNDTTARQITQASESSNPTVPGTFAYFGTGVNSSGLYTPKNVAAGTYPIKYVYTTSFSCADSVTKNITVWPSPQAKWGVNLLPLCEKNNILFTDSSVANYSNIVQRIWDFGDATNAVYTNTVSFKKQYAIGNTYTASLRVITDSGCRSVFNIQNLKINYLPVVSFTLPSICLPDGNGTFTSVSTIKDGTDALFSYLWNFGDPNDATSATTKIAKHKYSTVGPVNVQLKITSINGCIDSLTQQLNTIYPQPKASFIATPNQVCINSSIQFTDNSNGITSAPVSWFWDLANGNTSSQANPVKQFSDSGTFNISLYIYNQQGCVSDTAIQQVIVNPYPKLNMGPDLVVLQGGVIAIKPSYYGNNLSFKWTPASYLSSDTAAHPLASPPDDIRYYLVLTGIGGCSVNDSIFITVLKSPIIPNIFSPNGDGINDTWQIKYLDSYPGATVDVYNRYGQPVFHSNGYSIPWDGTYNGAALPVGTYYYVINPRNNKPIYNGSISIIR